MNNDLRFSRKELYSIVVMVKMRKKENVKALKSCDLTKCSSLAEAEANRIVIANCNDVVFECDVILDKINKMLDGGFYNE